MALSTDTLYHGSLAVAMTTRRPPATNEPKANGHQREHKRGGTCKTVEACNQRQAPQAPMSEGGEDAGNWL
jgi:hypothetical protein